MATPEEIKEALTNYSCALVTEDGKYIGNYELWAAVEGNNPDSLVIHRLEEQPK